MKACHDCVHDKYSMCRKHRTREALDAQLNRVRAYLMGKVAEYLFLPNTILNDIPWVEPSPGTETTL